MRRVELWRRHAGRKERYVAPHRAVRLARPPPTGGGAQHPIVRERREESCAGVRLPREGHERLRGSFGGLPWWSNPGVLEWKRRGRPRLLLLGGRRFGHRASRR